jgi:hypothetical protein
LCGRYRRLSAADKKLPVVIAPITREMAALLWAIGRHRPERDRHIALHSVGDGATEWNPRR